MKRNYLKPTIESKEVLVQSLLKVSDLEGGEVGGGGEGNNTDPDDAKIFNWDE